MNRAFGGKKIIRKNALIKKLSNIWPVGLKERDNCKFEIMGGINNSVQILSYAPTLVRHSLMGKRNGFPKECMEKVVGFGNVINRMNSDYIQQRSDVFVFHR
jgi:hypothetical protein